MGECIFCGIAAGTLPARRVYEDEDLLAFEDIHPRAPVHILIIPRRHVSSILDLEKSDHALMGSVLGLAGHLARERGLEQRGFRIVSNTGPDAGQSVFHIHFHLLGGRTLGWPPG